MLRKHKRKRYMGPYRPGMLFAGLAAWVLLLDMSLPAVRIAVAGTAAVGGSGSQLTPTAQVDTLLSVRKRIVLRTEEGAPVPGIEVHLAPADPALGGPETVVGTEARKVQEAITGSDGTATFAGLGQWTWSVSFSGSFRGESVQSVQEQGKSPYGRNRAGGGFPVLLERQEEDAPATPVVAQSTPLPEVQPSLFVLVPVDGIWVPALDLALPGEHPQPLSEPHTPASPTSQVSGPQPAAGASGATNSTGGTAPPEEDNLDSFIGWLYLLPAAIGLFAINRAWQDRRDRRERTQASRQVLARSNAEVLVDEVPVDMEDGR